MFYGTIASGIKVLDFFFYMLNLWFYCYVKFFDKVFREYICGGGGKFKFDVVNYV